METATYEIPQITETRRNEIYSAFPELTCGVADIPLIETVEDAVKYAKTKAAKVLSGREYTIEVESSELRDNEYFHVILNILRSKSNA